MALQKDKVTEYGVSANYWRLLTVSVNKNDESASIYIGLYKDQATREQVPIPVPLQIIQFNFPGPQLIGGTLQNVESPFTIASMSSKNIYQIAYSILKTLDVFSGAQDA